MNGKLEKYFYLLSQRTNFLSRERAPTDQSENTTKDINPIGNGQLYGKGKTNVVSWTCKNVLNLGHDKINVN